MIRSSRYARWSRSTALTAALALAELVPTRARAMEPPAQLPDYVELRVSESVVETEEIRLWASEATLAGLKDAEVQNPEAGPRRLAVEVAGEPLDYELTIGIRKGADWIGQPRKQPCRCDPDDLVAKIRTEVAAVAPQLVEAREVVPPPRVAPSETASAPAEPVDRKVPLSKAGKAGIALLAVGGAALAVGIGLSIRGERSARPEGDVERRKGADTSKPGYALLGIGGALLIPGIALLGHDRAHARKQRVKAAASIGREHLGLTLVGRF